MSQPKIAVEPTHIAAVTANQLLPGWIRRRRKSLDLTQADLANKLACSLSTVQKVEEGERRPSKNLAASLLEALEIPEGERPVFMRLARGKSAPRNEAAARTDRADTPDTPAAPNNTPFPINALIAREAETAWVQDLLAGDDARLVTLTGLPGIGKTRLAQHLAHAVHFEDGVCYVSLAAVPPQTSPQLACAAVAAAIAGSLRLNNPNNLNNLNNLNNPNNPDALIAHLREMHVLLVLDNFEHVLAGCDLLIQLLQETRWVKLLVTSRQRLRLRAEHVVQLAGLPMLVEDKDSPALQMFVARASRVAGPAFAEKQATPKMARICRLVDGLPLGIELACELTATQSLDEIGDAIERNFDVLQTTSPDVPEAHRSLRNLFTSLWGRLSLEEQRVVTQCAVFQDGFGLDEVSHLVQIGETPDVGCMRVRTLLDGLVEKSVLRRVTDDREASGLYRLHPLLRKFVTDSKGLPTAIRVH